MKKKTGYILITSLLLIVLLLLLFLRRSNKEDETEDAAPSETMSYEEYDTLRLDQAPPGIKEWLDFYKTVDTAFVLRNFKGSGVTIHIDSLPNAISITDEKVYKPFLAYSPDSTKYIDFLSYNQFIDTNKQGRLRIATGDPDQETSLVNKTKGEAKQLMYYGPGQAVEAAAWIDNQSFLLGIMSLDDSSRNWIPEIYLFNLDDFSFTNFRLTKNIPAEKLLDKKYFDHYFRSRNIIPD
ncbi:MAG: hypothetical protein SFU87_14670 [Chitinophagaceae bacterium]|nr:hypothetical protein [Chitinophagaceae bacterium]